MLNEGETVLSIVMLSIGRRSLQLVQPISSSIQSVTAGASTVIARSASTSPFKPLVSQLSDEGLHKSSDFDECMQRSVAAEQEYGNIKSICEVSAVVN